MAKSSSNKEKMMFANITKVYDFRGIAGQTINEDFAERLGRAFVIWRSQTINNRQLRLVVGRDMRITSPQLHDALIKGLLDQGAEVIETGLVSTPTFYFAVAYYGYDGGIMVSASHNPPEYNGFKLIKERALPISGDSGLEELLQLMEDSNWPDSLYPGKVTNQEGVVKDEVKIEVAGRDLTEIKPLRIVADTANGMGAEYLDALFRHLPQCTLVRMNWELDGTFPNHGADPLKPENIKPLEERVVADSADLGIAIDGDGDRLFFVDNKGQTVEPGILRAILAKIFLAEKPGAKIAYDIRPGRITDDIIRDNGGTPIITKVGHSLIKQQSVKEGVYFAGESSGHFFLQQDFGFFEVPLIVIVKTLKALSASGLTLADFVQPYRLYFSSGEINSQVADVSKVLKELADHFSDAEIDYLDGISIKYSDWWFNVRPSNNEPLVRLNLEAINEQLVKEKTREVLDIIRSSKS
ncbi:MAG: phosphomannomutase/phosphoglucomutase [Candidatus Komeilibacteria bacterium]